MRIDTIRSRSALSAVLLLGIVSACTGSDAAEPVTTTTIPATEERDDPTFQPAESDDPATGFDPEVVDDDLVPEVVDEVVLDDDVIIATEDGQVPTTTTMPPPSGTDPEPAGDTPAPTTTVPPAPAPAASTVARIVSLSPTHTETIAALGAAELLVGVDSSSDVPAGAPVEFDQFEVGDLGGDLLRSVAPDLVVIGEDDRGLGRQALAAAGVPFFDGGRPDSRAGVEQQILDLAAAIGRAEEGERLVQTMRDEIAAILASVPRVDGLTYFHEIDPGLATYTPGTLVDSLYAEFGLTSVVPPSELDALFLPPDQLFAGDPDVVVLGDIDCCAASAARAAARPGWSDLSATRNGAIVEVPDDVANRFGVNIVELMRLVAVGVAAAS